MVPSSLFWWCTFPGAACVCSHGYLLVWYCAVWFHVFFCHLQPRAPKTCRRPVLLCEHPPHMHLFQCSHRWTSKTETSPSGSPRQASELQASSPSFPGVSREKQNWFFLLNALHCFGRGVVHREAKCLEISYSCECGCFLVRHSLGCCCLTDVLSFHKAILIWMLCIQCFHGATRAWSFWSTILLTSPVTCFLYKILMSRG